MAGTALQLSNFHKNAVLMAGRAPQLVNFYKVRTVVGTPRVFEKWWWACGNVFVDLWELYNDCLWKRIKIVF